MNSHPKTHQNPPSNLYGLVLSGGQSTRMGEDKALINYHQQNQLERSFNLLDHLCEKTFLSVSRENANESKRREFPLIIDHFNSGGPLNGIASAFHAHPDKAWLILACDLPLLDMDTLEFLIAQRQAQKEATAFISNYDELPEPLCAIWEPVISTRVRTAINENRSCPRKILIQANTELLVPKHPHALDNANTPEERLRIANTL